MRNPEKVRENHANLTGLILILHLLLKMKKIKLKDNWIYQIITNLTLLK